MEFPLEPCPCIFSAHKHSLQSNKKNIIARSAYGRHTFGSAQNKNHIAHAQYTHTARTLYGLLIKHLRAVIHSRHVATYELASWFCSLFFFCLALLVLFTHIITFLYYCTCLSDDAIAVVGLRAFKIYCPLSETINTPVFNVYMKNNVVMFRVCCYYV